MTTTTEAALRQFDRIKDIERALANGAHYADDPECHPCYPTLVAARQELEKLFAALSQPSPASSTAGEVEQAAWAWLERRSAEHPNDVTAYGTDDMVDAFMAGAATYQRVLATFANDLEMADFANVGSALNERMCCNGHMCGCRGATVGEYLAHELRSLSPSSGEPASVAGQAFQQRVQPWMMECFGAEISADKVERNDRFIEEALELVQATGYSADRAHALVDYVFGRDVGEPTQEVGGVMVTLAALCLAHGLDMHSAGETELARINQPEIVQKIRAKQAAKPTGSALPIPLSKPTPVEAGLREAEVDRIVQALYEARPFTVISQALLDATSLPWNAPIPWETFTAMGGDTSGLRWYVEQVLTALATLQSQEGS